MALCREPVDALDSLVSEGLAPLCEELERGGSAAAGEAAVGRTWPTMTRATFNVYFRASLDALVTRTKAVALRGADEGAGVAEDRAAAASTSMHTARRLVGLFGELVSCSKYRAVGTRMVLQATIKGGNAFLKAYMASVMPLLERHFMAERDRFFDMLPELQKATRFMQRVCSQTKDVEMDEKLMALVPDLKRTLETIVFRTKVVMLCLLYLGALTHLQAILAKHNCSEAFWLGHLKNRDLQGQIMSSQLAPEEVAAL